MRLTIRSKLLLTVLLLILWLQWLMIASHENLFLATSGGLLLGFLAANALANNLSKRVKQIAQATENLQQGIYDKPIIMHDKDELFELAATFNYMVEHLAIREEKIRYQKDHDALTGLLLRDPFLQHLTHQVEEDKSQQQAFHLLIIGISNLSDIQYALGHPIADAVIIEMAKRLRSLLQQHDFLARLREEAFVLKLDKNKYQEENLNQLMAQGMAVLQYPLTIEEVNIDLNIHVGIACYPEHSKNAKRLLQCADIALYQSRQQGSKKYARYNEKLDPYNAARVSIMGDLKKGITNQDLQLYFQPKIHLATMKVQAVETLIRWKHHQFGFIPPEEFIQIAEQNGDIHEISYWVIRQAITQCQKWQQQGLNLSIGINLSAIDLNDDRIYTLLKESCERHQVAPEKITLEITESALMQNSARSIHLLHQLNQLGFILSIDDYGTGYSSLSYLKHLPVQELKIDRMFIMELEQSGHDAILVKSTIELAHELGLTVVAEGVENKQSLLKLHDLGCDLAQGYYFSEARSAAEFIKWLDNSPYLA